MVQLKQEKTFFRQHPEDSIPPRLPEIHLFRLESLKLVIPITIRDPDVEFHSVKIFLVFSSC